MRCRSTIYDNVIFFDIFFDVETLLRLPCQNLQFSAVTSVAACCAENDYIFGKQKRTRVVSFHLML